MIAKLGGRKMILGFLVIVVGISIDLSFGLGSNLLTLLIFVSSGFFLGNVGEHISETFKKKAGIPTENVVNVVNQIEQQLGDIRKVETNVNDKVDKLVKATEGNLEALNVMLRFIRGVK